LVSSNLTLPVSFSLWDQSSRWTIHLTKQIRALKIRLHSLTDGLLCFPSFQNLGIQCVRRREVRDAIMQRVTRGINPFGGEIQHHVFSPGPNRVCTCRKFCKFSLNWGKFIKKKQMQIPSGPSIHSFNVKKSTDPVSLTNSV